MDTKTLRTLATDLGKANITRLLQKEAARLKLGDDGQVHVGDLVDELLSSIDGTTIDAPPRNRGDA